MCISRIQNTALLIFCGAFPVFCSAEGEIRGWFDPPPPIGVGYTEFFSGKDVTVRGENLTGKLDSKQLLPEKRQLCLTNEINKNDSRCYDFSDKFVKSWSPNSITFSVPEDIFSRGTVKVRFYRYEWACERTNTRIVQFCDDQLKWGDEKTIGSFLVQPIINEVISPTGKADKILANTTYKITGVFFGTGRGNIFVGINQISPSNILTWDQNNISFNSGDFSGGQIRIESGSSTSKNYFLGSAIPISQKSSSSKSARRVIPTRIKTAPILQKSSSSVSSSIVKACTFSGMRCGCPRGYKSSKDSSQCVQY